MLNIWFALTSAIHSQIAPFYGLKCIFFLANETAIANQIQGLFKETNQIVGKWDQ